MDRKVDVIDVRNGAQSAVFFWGGVPIRSKLDCEKFVT